LGRPPYQRPAIPVHAVTYRLVKALLEEVPPNPRAGYGEGDLSGIGRQPEQSGAPGERSVTDKRQVGADGLQLRIIKPASAENPGQFRASAHQPGKPAIGRLKPFGAEGSQIAGVQMKFSPRPDPRL